MNQAQLAGLALGLAAVALGPFVWWLTRQAATGALGRNSWAGLRTSRTMQSDEAWVTGHRAALEPAAGMARRVGGMGALAVVMAVLGHTPQSMVAGFAALVLLLHGAFASVRAAHRAIDR
ncbi:SdpI family protein [Nocardioides piscis]|uniref:SdpI family protein n=1 Tax=Nocardioides piscis TaxID=2714938 RepID=UPI00197E16B0|nr:SdpI family protein [Nocardioides piscis]